MLDASSPSTGLAWLPLISARLDGLLASPFSLGYNISRGIAMPFPGRGAVGEPTAFAVAFLARALATGTPCCASVDWLLAMRTADEFVLGFPSRLPDGTWVRPAGWGTQAGHAFLWGDDQFMSAALLCRLARAGAPRAAEYLRTVTTSALTNARLAQDSASGLFPHGFNTLTNTSSCCTWGRANGWVAMALVELLWALEPSAPERVHVLDVFTRLVTGAIAVQSADGRWHQVLDAPSTFLETSASAMLVFALATGVTEGWLPHAVFAPAATRGWAGLTRAVDLSDGTVTGICEGTPVLLTVAAYNARTTFYNSSQSGLGAVFRAALAVAAMASR